MDTREWHYIWSSPISFLSCSLFYFYIFYLFLFFLLVRIHWKNDFIIFFCPLTDGYLKRLVSHIEWQAENKFITTKWRSVEFFYPLYEIALYDIYTSIIIHWALLEIYQESSYIYIVKLNHPQLVFFGVYILYIYIYIYIYIHTNFFCTNGVATQVHFLSGFLSESWRMPQCTMPKIWLW